MEYLAGPTPPGSPRRPAGRPAAPAAELSPEGRAALAAYVQACAENLHSPRGRAVWDWLTRQRAIPPAVLDHAGVGADPGPRFLPRPAGIPKAFPAAVFPVRDLAGVTYTLSRLLAPRPEASRWLNTAEAFAPNPRVSFYSPPPGSPTRSELVVTEGPIDALSAIAAGLPAAALLGTSAAAPAVAARLAATGRHVVLALDNDPAGRAATDRLATLLEVQSAIYCRLTLPQWASDLNDWHTACGRHWPQILKAALHVGNGAVADHPAVSIL